MRYIQGCIEVRKISFFRFRLLKIFTLSGLFLIIYIFVSLPVLISIHVMHLPMKLIPHNLVLHSFSCLPPMTTVFLFFTSFLCSQTSRLPDKLSMTTHSLTYIYSSLLISNSPWLVPVPHPSFPVSHPSFTVSHSSFLVSSFVSYRQIF